MFIRQKESNMRCVKKVMWVITKDFFLFYKFLKNIIDCLRIKVVPTHWGIRKTSKENKGQLHKGWRWKKIEV